MAMEKQAVIRETHHRAVTALGYHPLRREILAGFEDGVIKTWEAEGSKLVFSTAEHQGWVTDFLYWQEGKVMFSSSNDGTIIAWASGGGVHDKIDVGFPIYTMAINLRRHQLVCGFNGFMCVYGLDENRESGHMVELQNPFVSKEHTDIVKCIACLESRVYSAGFDQKLIIYDSSSYPGNRGLSPVFRNPKAHEAGICCLLLVKDTENNTWLITGSFDKVVKIWSQDGKLTHRLDGFISTITDLCYVPKIKTLWVASGAATATLYDPKSGDNVSDFIGTFQVEETEKYQLQLMKYFPELNEVVASTSRRHLVIWKYNPSGCITALKCMHAVECLTYTRKVPILIFDGGSDGDANKWERLQSNHFMYSKETFLSAEAKNKLAQLKNIKKESGPRMSGRAASAPVSSHYAFNKPLATRPATQRHNRPALLKAQFVEPLDMLLLGSEEGNIFVWGFDDAAVNALRNMKPVGLPDLVKKYAVLLGNDSELLPDNASYDSQSDVLSQDSVTNRVAGFVCKNVLMGHSSCVTCLTLVGRESGYPATYLLSSGWDRRICIWDLEKGRLHDTFYNTTPDVWGSEELACDGIVIDMDYSPTRNEYAYASSDKMVYIRRFSEKGSEMKLCNTLQGHEGEITQVKWNGPRNTWVTGSEDGTIRIWSGDGMSCEQVLNTHGPVSALCIDTTNSCIVAGIQNNIKVYDPETFKLVQTNIGHTDSIRSIVHVPERNQYVSGSWDCTLRVWNAYKLIVRKRKSTKADENRGSTSVQNGASNPSYLIEEDDIVFTI